MATQRSREIRYSYKFSYVTALKKGKSEPQVRKKTVQYLVMIRETYSHLGAHVYIHTHLHIIYLQYIGYVIGVHNTSSLLY